MKAENIDLTQISRLYFLGIGGIGMSALARYFQLKGLQVSGYDRRSSVITKALENEGIEIFHVLDEAHIDGAELVVYTPAIPVDNIEYQAVLKRGLPLLKRSLVLGLISKEYRTLAVAGTHGKTTTSTLLTHVLIASGVSCTAFLGGISTNLNSNFAFGESDWMVVEADEFDRSFLTLSPEHAAITSLDPDHLDIYGSAEVMGDTYREFSDLVSGKLLVAEEIADAKWNREVESYGVDVGRYQAQNLVFEAMSTRFDFVAPGLTVENIRLSLPGHHNVSNAVAALALALEAGADPRRLKVALESFQGIYRRFELQWDHPELTYVDDYAHHPSELVAAMKTARSLFPDRKLVVVFQPHLFSRTQDFQEGFAAALSDADAVVMMEIYPAREKPIPGVNSQMILDKVQAPEKALASRENLGQQLAQFIQSPTILLTLGAGDIDREVPKIKQWATEKFPL